MSRKKSKFGANVVGDVERRKKEGSAYGYLNLPKGLTMFKESEAKLFLDFIPYVVSDEKHMDRNEAIGAAIVGEDWYKKPIRVHRGIGVENESLVCPTTFGKKCPICEYRDKQFKDGTDKDDVIGKYQLRNLYLVVPIGNKNFEEEVHLWDISDYLFQEKLDDQLEEEPENGIFPDLKDGKTVKVRFSEESFRKNKFYEASRVDFEERDEEYDEEIMDELHNLDEIFTVLSYKELEAKFYELDEDDLEAEPDDSTPFDDDDKPEKHLKSFKKKKDKKKDKDKPKKDKDKDECPNDHRFGKDWDGFDDCDDCDIFDACNKAND